MMAAMEKLQVMIFVFVALAVVRNCLGKGYTRVDKCSVSSPLRLYESSNNTIIQNREMCMYTYSSEQDSEEGGLNFNTSFTTTVKVTCESGIPLNSACSCRDLQNTYNYCSGFIQWRRSKGVLHAVPGHSSVLQQTRRGERRGLRLRR